MRPDSFSMLARAKVSQDPVAVAYFMNRIFSWADHGGKINLQQILGFPPSPGRFVIGMRNYWLVEAAKREAPSCDAETKATRLHRRLEAFMSRKWPIACRDGRGAVEMDDVDTFLYYAAEQARFDPIMRPGHTKMPSTRWQLVNIIRASISRE